MALPKLNDKPLYSITIPSTGQNVRFRPYLVKEEKILMMAMETKDPRAGVDAIIDTIVSCIDEPIDRKSLKIFDVEYLFIKIRGKSVGEVSKVSMKCKACEELNDVDINLDEIDMKVENRDSIIQLTDDVKVKMQWPSYSIIVNQQTDNENVIENAFSTIISCIHSIQTEEENILASDVTHKELEDFVDSMTSDQLESIKEFIEGMPKLKHKVDFRCTSCSEYNKEELEGIQDFF